MRQFHPPAHFWLTLNPPRTILVLGARIEMLTGRLGFDNYSMLVRIPEERSSVNVTSNPE